VQFFASVACSSGLGTPHKCTQSGPDKFVGASCNCWAWCFHAEKQRVCDHVVLILSLVSDFECGSFDTTNASKLLLDQLEERILLTNQKMLRNIRSSK